MRATALGVTTGVGRLGAVTGPLLGGLMLSAGVEYGWVFASFGAIALIGAVACLLVPRPVPAEPEMTDPTSLRITERLR